MTSERGAADRANGNDDGSFEDEDQESRSESRRDSKGLSLARMAQAGLRHAWRVNASVALGVATATAVVVGALLVGDSMRGSLRALTVERLGEVDSVVIPGTFFDAEGVITDRDRIEPLLYFPSGSIEARDDAPDARWRRVGSVQIIGCDPTFWDLGVDGVRPEADPDDDGLVLNASAAAELGVEVGDEVTLRLPVEGAVPADSPLGRRDVQSEGLPRMEVLDIVPDRGLGRFAIEPSQATPMNVYVARATIADVLDRDGQANALLLREGVTRNDLRIDVAALGLSLQRVRREFTPGSGEPEVVYDYVSLTSDRLLLPDVAVRRLIAELPEGSAAPLMTYLANAIERVDDDGEVIASVPYSTVTAAEPSEKLPLDFGRDAVGGSGSGSGSDENSRAVPIVLNAWAAERLGAEIGDSLRVAYYEPEVEGGREVERTFGGVVTGVVALTEPSSPYTRRRPAEFDKRPTVYNDPDLTPTVPGVTDQASISDWDLPFPLDREIEPEDDEYWNNHRLTPKAFLPLADGRRLFGSRFGDTTSLRIDPSAAGVDGSDAADAMKAMESIVRETLEPVLGELGWLLIPIRERQFAASQGTTPFDALFLSLSFFVIMAAVMLIAMLFRLGLVERVRQFGTLMAVGWTPRRVASLVFLEGIVVAAVGVLLGAAGGFGYASAVLWALRSWWVGAVTVPFLEFHWTVVSLLGGVIAGWLVALVTIGVTIRSLLRADAQTLLSGREGSSAATDSRGKSQDGKTQGAHLGRDRGRGLSAGSVRWLDFAAALAVVAALAVAAFGATASGQEAAAGFVGGGMLLLIAAMFQIHRRLSRRRQGPETTAARKVGDRGSEKGDAAGRISLAGLAARSATRQPIRSTLSIGLMAAAAFLIVAMSAFRLQPSDRGTGGFELLGRTSQPLFGDLGDPQERADLLGSDAEVFDGVTVAAWRLRPGQDASCNNLYQASQPTVLGVPSDFAGLFATGGEGVEVERAEAAGEFPGFEWAAREERDGDGSPWELLATAASGTKEDPIPVVLDQNTAMWSLQLREGIGEIASFEYEVGEPTYFRVVGLLSNSMLQGQLLIGEENFEAMFPSISGYRFFLIGEAGSGSASAGGDGVDWGARRAVLEDRLGDVGMDVRETRDILASLLAVQNTYLRTFQTLGGLGLLLGTVGLAVAQVRSVLERRRELAVMRAIGFTRGRLAGLVMGETAVLLVAGIGCGVCCAVLAVMPYAIANSIRPPIVEPLAVVTGVTLFGMLAGLLAVRRVLRMPLLSSLRAE